MPNQAEDPGRLGDGGADIRHPWPDDEIKRVFYVI